MLLGSTIISLLCSTLLCQGCHSLPFHLFACPPMTPGSEVTAAPGQVAGEKEDKAVLVCGGGPLSHHAAGTRRHTTLQPSPGPHSRSLPSASGTVIRIAQCWERSQEMKI